MFDGIDALEARYVASYKKAVEFAYHALGNFTKQSKDEENIGTGADCHKLIMMFRYECKRTDSKETSKTISMSNEKMKIDAISFLISVMGLLKMRTKS